MNSEIAYILGRAKVNNSKITSNKLFDLCERIGKLINEGDIDLTTDLFESEYASDYIRGMYECTYNKRDPNTVLVSCKDSDVSDKIQKVSRAKGVFTNGTLTFVNHNALDFLSFVYINGKSEHSDFCYKKYIHLSSNAQVKSSDFTKFKYRKISKDAIAPFKDRASDSGYDLTLVKLIKRVGNTYWYSTGISVEPPNGFYFDLVPRSSLSKTGFMLANSVGVIDRSYTGDIIVVLNQIDHTMPELELPFRAVQIIPRSIVNMIPECVEELSTSDRADKGFGSSGNF